MKDVRPAHFFGGDKLLFSVTASDCRFDYYRGTGAGGQKKNKTSSACRCTHILSGAVGQAEDDRSQHVNKRLAFGRMAATAKFKAWHTVEVARRTGELKRIEEQIEFDMQHRIKVEVQDNGRWVPEK
jgi:protein subunit release factor B